MKTLLASLATLSVSTPTALAPLATKSINNEYNESSSLVKHVQWHEPKSMYDLQSSVDEDYQASKKGSQFAYRETLRSAVQEKYDMYFKNLDFPLEKLSETPGGEVVDQEFRDVYKNNTPNPQTFQTQSYSRSVSDTTTFSAELTESVGVEFNTGLILDGITVSASLSSTRAWSDSKSVTKTVTIPSQSFVVQPFSQGIATYTISSKLTNFRGVIRREWGLINAFRTRRHVIGGSTKVVHSFYAFSKIAEALKESGHSEYLKMSSAHSSILSVDNVENPSKFYVNVPIDWVTKSGMMKVRFTQEPLK